MTPVDLIADVVLDGVAVEEAVDNVLRFGHPPAGLVGLRDLQAAVSERRKVVDHALPLDPVLAELARSIDQAARRELRTLFSDPDDLARLDEAELQLLPAHAAVAYQILVRRTWRSEHAAAIFTEAKKTVGERVRRVIVERALERLNELEPADLETMIKALRRTADLITAPTGLPIGADVDLRPLLTMITERSAEPTLEALLDELAWRRSAQHELLAVIDDPSRRRLTAAWQQLTRRPPPLQETITGLHRQLTTLRPWAGGNHGDDQLAGYLFTDLFDPIAETAELESLNRGLAQDYPGAGLDDIDEESTGRLLGHEARQQLIELRQIARTLTTEAPQIRRALPRAGLRRALTPKLRRRLSAVGSNNSDDHEAVVLVINRAIDDASAWAAVRSAALAVPPLVSRYRPADTVAAIVINEDGTAKPIPTSGLTDLAPAIGPTAPLDPDRMIGLIRRTLARTGAEHATVLLIGNDRTEPTTVRRLDRLSRQQGWSFGLVQVPPHETTDRDRVTATMQHAAELLINHPPRRHQCTSFCGVSVHM